MPGDFVTIPCGRIFGDIVTSSQMMTQIDGGGSRPIYRLVDIRKLPRRGARCLVLEVCKPAYLGASPPLRLLVEDGSVGWMFLPDVDRVPRRDDD